jgi:hypothetical protein
MRAENRHPLFLIPRVLIPRERGKVMAPSMGERDPCLERDENKSGGLGSRDFAKKIWKTPVYFCRRAGRSSPLRSGAPGLVEG